MTKSRSPLHFVPLQRLAYASYPVVNPEAQLKDDWLDVLYLGRETAPTLAEIQQTEDEMRKRLKWRDACLKNSFWWQH